MNNIYRIKDISSGLLPDVVVADVEVGKFGEAV